MDSATFEFCSGNSRGRFLWRGEITSLYTFTQKLRNEVIVCFFIILLRSSPIISFNDSCPRHSRLPKDIGLSITRFPRIEDKIENTREKLAARNQGIQFRVGEEPRCSSIGLDRSRRLEPNKYRSSSPYESEIDSREIEASMCLLQFR